MNEKDLIHGYRNTPRDPFRLPDAGPDWPRGRRVRADLERTVESNPSRRDPLPTVGLSRNPPEVHRPLGVQDPLVTYLPPDVLVRKVK